MRKLLDAYGAAVAARACALHVSIAAGYGPGNKAPLLVEAERVEAEAREELEGAIAQACADIGEAISLADDTRTDKRILRADDTTLVAYGSQANDRAGVDRYRKPTLKDAKRNAEMIARRCRKAWDILDPCQ